MCLILHNLHGIEAAAVVNWKPLELKHFQWSEQYLPVLHNRKTASMHLFLTKSSQNNYKSLAQILKEPYSNYKLLKQNKQHNYNFLNKLNVSLSLNSRISYSSRGQNFHLYLYSWDPDKNELFRSRTTLTINSTLNT